ncbi:MAG: DNA-processing protein DprA [Pirellulaceae bacterium]|nr:DNA-processing protein DprA [Planctomycetales bacterium]
MSLVTETGRVPNDPALLDSLCLSLIPGIGPTIRRALVERFGSATAVLDASVAELTEVPGVGMTTARAIADGRQAIDARRRWQWCVDRGIRILTIDMPTYPRLLREIHDPPNALFYRGELLPQDGLAIAIVGTRHASSYGTQQARQLAAMAARSGLTVVSGLARGVDAAAHRGTLEAGGRTLAILPGGLEQVYPTEHEGLAEEIAKQGAVISESITTHAMVRGTFPRRNRIITGLTVGTIVIEAGTRSGALVSARLAMEQGREVFAMPGRVDSRNSHGCHRLLKDGATLIETIDDVLEQLGPMVEATPRADGTMIRHPAELQINDQEQRVLNAIDTTPTLIDDVVVRSGLPIQRILATISVLERRRLVRKTSGSQVMRI